MATFSISGVLTRQSTRDVQSSIRTALTDVSDEIYEQRLQQQRPAVNVVLQSISWIKID